MSTLRILLTTLEQREGLPELARRAEIRTRDAGDVEN